jgi:hypothetical protein
MTLQFFFLEKENASGLYGRKELNSHTIFSSKTDHKPLILFAKEKKNLEAKSIIVSSTTFGKISKVMTFNVLLVEWIVFLQSSRCSRNQSRSQQTL